jgi:hypothetical protein
MLRVFLEIVLPLLLPTLLYLLWVGALRPTQPSGAVRSAGMPWLWLGGAGMLLVAIVIFLIVASEGSQQGVYVPPHLQGDRIVPGHFEPKPRP